MFVIDTIELSTNCYKTTNIFFDSGFFTDAMIQSL